MKIVVYQCSQCKKIICDTTKYTRLFPSLNGVAVASLPDCKIDSTRRSDHTGKFQTVHCGNCKSYIGKQYENSSIEELKGKLLLDLSRLLNYLLEVPQSAPQVSSTPSGQESLQQRVANLEKLTVFLYDTITELKKGAV